VIWVSGQVEREVPNLLSQFLHRYRLGEVIDEVLGLSGTADAASRSDRGSDEVANAAREIKRYSPES
jgi:hypothetical protein